MTLIQMIYDHDHADDHDAVTLFYIFIFFVDFIINISSIYDKSSDHGDGCSSSGGV